MDVSDNIRAQIENHVFIHGGVAGVSGLNDFWMLNMALLSWTKLVDARPPLKLHSLSPISPLQLLFVGGCDPVQ